MSFTCKRLFIKERDKTLVDISFEIENSLALIGESGSGKSLTLKALLGMLPQNLEMKLEYDGDYRLQRGKSVALIPQNPFTALSPLTKIEKQFFLDSDKIKEYLDMVGLDFEIARRFPSELSGGQLQRVVIAMALALRPKLLLLDEPTTALDKKSKEGVLNLLRDLQKREKFDMLFVTHDIFSVENLCEKIAILNRGKIVEEGDMQKVLESPTDLYTKRLIDAGFKNREFRR